MERVSRRRLLAASGGAVLAASAITQVASAQSNNPRRSPWDLAFDVAMEMPPAAAAPVAPAAAAPGPFYMTGGIYAPGAVAPDGTVASGAARVGTFRVWGWNYDPTRPGAGGSVGTASFDLTGRGQIVAGGAWVAGRFAILAGTGEFRGANGQVDVTEFSPNAMRAIFDYSSPYAGT